MGLSITHDTFQGGYGTFGSWRRRIAELAGYTYTEKNNGYFTGWVANIDWSSMPTDADLHGHWTREPEDALLYLIVHADDQGELSPLRCARLADRLQQLMPQVAAADNQHQFGFFDTFEDMTRRFIIGLRTAAQARENIEFH